MQVVAQIHRARHPLIVALAVILPQLTHLRPLLGGKLDAREVHAHGVGHAAHALTHTAGALLHHRAVLHHGLHAFLAHHGATLRAGGCRCQQGKHAGDEQSDFSLSE